MEQEGTGSSREVGEGEVWQVNAEGVAPEILELASAWVSATGGDAVMALILMSERLLTWRSFSSVGMTRGTLSVFPERVGTEDEGRYSGDAP